MLDIDPANKQHVDVEYAVQRIMLQLCQEINCSARSSIHLRTVDRMYRRKCMNMNGAIAEGFNCDVQVLPAAS